MILSFRCIYSSSIYFLISSFPISSFINGKLIFLIFCSMVLFSKLPDIGLIISLSVFLPSFLPSFLSFDNIGVDGNDGSSRANFTILL